MLTIVLTYRNRDLRIVDNSLLSLKNQSVKTFKVIFVDYGSDLEYANGALKIVEKYNFVEFVMCPVQGQLWNKSRAINIALRKTKTPYFLVGDVDMIFSQNFVETSNAIANNCVTYFQCGFISKKESLLKKEFQDYKVAFKSDYEATGIALFSTNQLKSIGGFDEFYHGWGGEDTDVHYRMIAKGVKINFYNQHILVKHQWHPKLYRTKQSKAPFNSQLERINQYYLKQTKLISREQANTLCSWGEIPRKEKYDELSLMPKYQFVLKPLNVEFLAVLAQLKSINNGVVRIFITDISTLMRLKFKMKKCFNRWSFSYLKMETINNLLLEEIIKNYRGKPYTYSFDRDTRTIECVINFS